MSGADFLGEGTEWGARLSVRKQKRLFEALENEESMARGKGRRSPRFGVRPPQTMAHWRLLHMR